MSAPARFEIRPAEIPKYVPGKVWLDALDRSWTGISARGYTYGPSEVAHPPISDFVLVAYRTGTTRMTRRANGPSRSCQVAPGHVSLLTSNTASEWAWEKPIDVLHVYIETGLMSEVVESVFNRGLAGAQLYDLLDVKDDCLLKLSDILIDEAQHNEPGSRLFVELLAHQLCIHLVRRYFDLEPSAVLTIGAFDQSVVNRVRDYIMENLGEDLCLAALSRVARVSPSHFGRVFRRAFGVPPHRFILNARLDKARNMLADRRLAIAEVAAATGFADQSHLTRHFRHQFKVTPDQYRRS